jgi:hypothetical protein
MWVASICCSIASIFAVNEVESFRREAIEVVLVFVASSERGPGSAIWSVEATALEFDDRGLCVAGMLTGIRVGLLLVILWSDGQAGEARLMKVPGSKQ